MSYDKSQAFWLLSFESTEVLKVFVKSYNVDLSLDRLRDLVLRQQAEVADRQLRSEPTRIIQDASWYLLTSPEVEQYADALVGYAEAATYPMTLQFIDAFVRANFRYTS